MTKVFRLYYSCLFPLIIEFFFILKLNMNFECFKLYIQYNFFFKLIFLTKFTNRLFRNCLKFWKISAYADGYWFLYSNKKSLFELRHL